MDWGTFSTTVLTSGITAGAVGFFFYNQQKKVDFKYTYKSFVLNKRIAAYDGVEKILLGISTKNSVRKTHQFISEDSSDLFGSYHDQLTLLLNKEYWLSTNLTVMIKELLAIVAEMRTKFDPKLERTFQDQKFEIGISFSKPLDFYCDRIQEIYFNDLVDLDDISKFKKSKRRA